MLSGCNLFFSLIYFLVFFFPGFLVAATTMGYIWAVGSMGLLRAVNKWASNRALELVGLGSLDKWVYMGLKRA